jgi:hypothetical protein
MILAIRQSGNIFLHFSAAAHLGGVFVPTRKFNSRISFQSNFDIIGQSMA